MAVKKSSSDKSKRKATTKKTSPALGEQNGKKHAEKVQSITSITVTEYEVRRRAYELYEARGRQDGFDWEDWIQAEAEVRSRPKESA